MRLPIVPKGPVYRDDDDKRHQESRNGVVQFQFVLATVSEWSSDSRLDPALILELQRLAVNQVYRCAGYFRDGPVSILGVDHQPPDHTEVPELVGAMCDYVNQNWNEKPIHLAAFVMWRMNWIHPFFGGNGRTARAASYLVLSAALGFHLPGAPTIPELVVDHRDSYQAALKSADDAWQAGRVDISAMEDLLSSLLAAQLVSIHRQATGNSDSG